MKKILASLLTAVMCLCCLTSCALFTHKKNEWFSEEKLAKCLVSDMPQLDCDYVRERDKVIYANLTDEEKDRYINELYNYLLDKNFKHLGTQGGIASSLSGAFTTYYLEPATELSEFNIHSNTYKFVYSDGKISMSSDDDDFTFCILTVVKYEDACTLEYGMREFEYNFSVSLKFNSEAPLGGRYTLKDEEHEHTYQNYCDENGHGWSYTCGCITPPNFAQHSDGDYDQKCDYCGYDLPLRVVNDILRNQDGCEWLNEITAADVAEIKIISEAVGVAPGNLKFITSSTDEAAITRLFNDLFYCEILSVPKEEGEIDGGGAVTIKLVLKDGTERKLYINNGNYRDTNGNYYELLYVPKFKENDNVTEAHEFITYKGTGTVYDKDNVPVCEIPISELEFVEFDGNADAEVTGDYYTVETDFGTLYFPNSNCWFYLQLDDEENSQKFYMLVGKKLDVLIDEFSQATTE